MLQTKVNNEVRLREETEVLDRKNAIKGEIKQYLQLGLLLGVCKTAISKDKKVFSDLLAFSIGGAAIGAIVGSIKYRKVSEEIFIKTQNFYASRQNNPPQENFLKIVTGYWKYEKTPKVYRGRKLLLTIIEGGICLNLKDVKSIEHLDNILSIINMGYSVDQSLK